MATSTIKGITESTATASSGHSLVRNRVIRKGNTLRIVIEASGAVSANAYNSIAVLPVGYRPNTQIVKAFVPTAGATGYLRILTDGRIDVYSTIATSSVYIDETILGA